MSRSRQVHWPANPLLAKSASGEAGKLPSRQAGSTSVVRSASRAAKGFSSRPRADVGARLFPVPPADARVDPERTCRPRDVGRGTPTNRATAVPTVEEQPCDRIHPNPPAPTARVPSPPAAPSNEGSTRRSAQPRPTRSLVRAPPAAGRARRPPASRSWISGPPTPPRPPSPAANATSAPGPMRCPNRHRPNSATTTGASRPMPPARASTPPAPSA